MLLGVTRAWRCWWISGTSRGSTREEFRGEIADQIACLSAQPPDLFGKSVQAFNASVVILHARNRR